MPRGIYDRSKAKPRAGSAPKDKPTVTKDPKPGPVRPARKDLLGDPVRTGRRATRTVADAEEQHKAKRSGFAIGVGEANYWWITQEAERRGIDRTAYLKQIIAAYIKALPIVDPSSGP